MRAFRERELMKEKMKNNNIIREVLKKQVKDAQDAKNYKPNDEIEALLIDKYKKEARKIKIASKEDNKGYYIRRQALIDKVLLKNDNAMKSLAEKKRLWGGEGGTYAKKDLAKWYKVYN